jgi:hypothetical protein
MIQEKGTDKIIWLLSPTEIRKIPYDWPFPENMSAIKISFGTSITIMDGFSTD